MHFRSVFLSDVHLGSPDCQADKLLDFLAHVSCDQLYLVGDIIDFWALKKRVRWPDAHTAVVSRIIELSRAGARVVYIPGNHDEAVRKVHGSYLGGVEITDELTYRTARGERLLILHGDIFDDMVLTGSWQHRLGADLYDVLLGLSRKLNAVRRLLGFPHWSLAASLKYQFADAVQHIADYEYAAAREAALRFMDGIVCGHIHHPNARDIEGISYYNCGDWIEHTTALAETREGEIVQLDWERDRDRIVRAGHVERARVRQKVERAA